MKEYEVNDETMAILGVDNNNSKVYENNKEYKIASSSYEVMDYSCQYFGSSYSGRVDGSKRILGANYKLPIIVEESSEMIFFPITSPEKSDCIWIALKWYKNVEQVGNTTYIILKNGKKIKTIMSKKSIENQVMRASRLNLILNERKSTKI